MKTTIPTTTTTTAPRRDPLRRAVVTLADDLGQRCVELACGLDTYEPRSLANTTRLAVLVGLLGEALDRVGQAETTLATWLRLEEQGDL